MWMLLLTSNLKPCLLRGSLEQMQTKMFQRVELGGVTQVQVQVRMQTILVTLAEQLRPHLGILIFLDLVLAPQALPPQARLEILITSRISISNRINHSWVQQVLTPSPKNNSKLC